MPKDKIYQQAVCRGKKNILLSYISAIISEPQYLEHTLPNERLRFINTRNKLQHWHATKTQVQNHKQLARFHRPRRNCLRKIASSHEEAKQTYKRSWENSTRGLDLPVFVYPGDICEVYFFFLVLCEAWEDFPKTSVNPLRALNTPFGDNLPQNPLRF